MIKKIYTLELTDCLAGHEPAQTTFSVPGHGDAAMTITTDCDCVHFSGNEMHAIYNLLHEVCA